MTTDGTPWWEVLGLDRSVASALHRVKDMSRAIAAIQQAFIKELCRISVRNAAGMAWAKPGEFDDLVDAVHEAWLELGVTR